MTRGVHYPQTIVAQSILAGRVVEFDGGPLPDDLGDQVTADAQIEPQRLLFRSAWEW